MSIKTEIKDGNLIVTLPISPHSSKSGKTLVIASSGGNIPTTCEYDEKVVIVGINAYVKK